MPTHAEKRVVPYSADQMYALIADVGSYPEFLPWCAAARMRSRTPLPDGTRRGDGGRPGRSRSRSSASASAAG